MKKEEITIQKVKNNPAGGVLIGKDKEGQTIIPNDGSLGGFLVGKLHKEGGIKAVNMGNGQPIEMQSNEIVITAPAVSDTTKKEFQGKMMTNRQILSKINSDGGGVSFAESGMEVPKSIKHTGASYKYGGKTMTDHEIMTSMNGGGTMLLAPNGKPSNLNAEQYKLVRTPAFKKWFGDWENDPDNASKVVDENGEPLIVYHGTIKNFNVFDTEKSRFNGGIYFSSSKEFSKKFAGINGNVKDFFIKIINPLNSGFDGSGVGSQMSFEHRDGGIFTKRQTDNYGKKGIKEYIVGEPTQIKLADGTNTTFDANNPDIRFDSGGHLADGFSLRDIADIHQVPLVELKKQVKSGMEAESEHTSSKREQMKIVKDHLFENPKYYTLLKKVGLKKGGEVENLVKDAKNGNSPSRDLNNYNDLLDVQVDGAVGGDSGIYVNGGETDLSFLDDVTKVFDDGGSTGLPKVNSVKITAVGSSTTYGDFIGKVFNNYIDLATSLQEIFAQKNKVSSYFYFTVNDTKDRFGIQFKNGKNTVLNFNPLTGSYKDFEKQIVRRYPTSSRRFDWNDFINSRNRGGSQTTSTTTETTTATKSNDDKFTEAEIEAFNKIDKIVKENNLDEVNSFSWSVEDGLTKDFDFSIDGILYQFRSYNTVLGAVQEDNDRFKSLALINKYNAWKKSTPNESKAIEITSMVIDYIDLNDNTVKSNIDNVFNLKEELDILQQNYDAKFVRLYPIEGANPTGVQSRIYITMRPTSDIEDFHTLNSKVSDLKEKLKLLFVAEGYKWDKFFNTEKESQTQTPTTSEPTTSEPTKSNRNFQLERKYLTSRINELSKELDMKRPTLLNEEIAFYQREINKFILKLRKVMNDENEEKPISDRMEAVYSVKFGDYNKDYPQTDLVSYNGVKSELTDEEYLTVRTPEFKAFFGDWEQGNSAGVSKVINQKTKEPLAVWHGTNVLFTEWKTYATNNAHYFSTKKDFSEFFASEWENRTDKAGVDSKVLKDLNPNKGKFLFRCFIDVRNPIDFSRFGVDKRPISDYLTFLKINYNIGDYDFWTGLGNASGFTKETKVYAWQIIRLWQNFTNYVKLYTTYDGYIFYEYNPNTPTGGLENASLCFCAFESNQVKFTNAYEFNALSNDSRFDFGGEI